MKKQNLITAGAVLAAGLAAAPALAAGAGPKVTLRVEGLHSTVLLAKSVTTPGSGSVTKDGVKDGACPADSAQGALNVATHGNWKGTWSASYKEYFITSILNNTPNPKKDYYEIFVNNVAASAGACDISLKAGDTLLFAAVPDSGAAETPLGLTVVPGGTGVDRATVLAYNAKGKASPLTGATISDGTASYTTGSNGSVDLPVPASGRTVIVTATAPGHIRAEAALQAGSVTVG